MPNKPSPSLSQRLQDAVPDAVPFSSVWFRNVPQQFASQHDILSARGSLITGGRFNFKGLFEILYLSCDVHTCLEETTKSFSLDGLSVARALPRTIIGIEVKLTLVLDLSHSTIRRRLRITRASLVGTDWEMSQNVHGREGITQEVGRLARNAGFEAVLVPSAATRHGRNLAIFPDRLLPGSKLSLVNPDRLL